jgi:putative iron-regulated protein
MKYRNVTNLLILSSALALACSEDKDAGMELVPEAAATYASIVSASYVDSLATAGELDAAISTFVGSPSQSNLENARTAWLDSREPYLQTEVYRFYEGPIDNETDGPEGLLNAWPMDESHVDYTMGQMGLDNTGIVNDTSITIDAATLLSKNEEGGEENVATGYHALEFLLWGQDMSADGPGNRMYTDYTDRGDAGSFGCYNMDNHSVDCEATQQSECAAGTMWVESACATNNDRRGQYLTVASSLLLTHLSDLDSAWASDASNYRADFEGEEGDEQLRRMLTGMIVLSGFETGGERLQTALDSGDQEDEHSCFSDNTHRDMIQDVQGVQNVYIGSYGSVSGTSLKDVVAEMDSELADRLEAEITASLDAANALQPPFDNEIALENTEGRERVQTLITALRTQESTLEEVFRGFGLAVPEVE